MGVRACTKSLVEWIDSHSGKTHPARSSVAPDLRSKVRTNNFSSEVKTLMKGAFSFMAENFELGDNLPYTGIS